jgi:hypothetical protein
VDDGAIMFSIKRVCISTNHFTKPDDNWVALDQVITQIMESSASRPIPATEDIINNLPRELLMEQCLSFSTVSPTRCSLLCVASSTFG